MALYRKNCMTLFVDINVIATYDINDINLEVDINVSLPLGTMLALYRRRQGNHNKSKAAVSKGVEHPPRILLYESQAVWCAPRTTGLRGYRLNGSRGYRYHWQPGRTIERSDLLTNRLTNPQTTICTSD